MKSERENQNGGAVASKDGLGINRVGDAILCYAHGETDRPDVYLARSAADVLRFIVMEWIDDVNDPTVKEVMAELEKHDWNEESALDYQFEIGGVRFEDVVAVMPPTQPLNSTEKNWKK
jgi:hypothetical protein